MATPPSARERTSRRDIVDLAGMAALAALIGFFLMVSPTGT